jgi:hypothetical protein
VSDAELLAQVSEHLHRFERSVFRLEALDHYTSDAEDEDMRRWFAGEPVSFASDDDYFHQVRNATAAGKTWQRVHAVSGPTPYVRFEVEGYAENEAAGEDVRILQAANLEAIFGEQPPDFWLFDDALVLRYRSYRGNTGHPGSFGALPVPSAEGRRSSACRPGA